jgi:hypothetical protein
LNDTIEVSLDRLREIIATLEPQPFSTKDVLRAYSGGFHSNRNTPAYYSFNAQFGKLLKRNEQVLSIVEVEKDVPTEDDEHHPTTTSLWRRR